MSVDTRIPAAWAAKIAIASMKNAAPPQREGHTDGPSGEGQVKAERSANLAATSRQVTDRTERKQTEGFDVVHFAVSPIRCGTESLSTSA